MHLFIHHSDSISDVKVRIQTICNGFCITRQKLDYGVTGGSVLHLLLKKLYDPLLVSLITTSSQVFYFHVDLRKNVGYLKKRISKEGNKGFLDVDDQEIFFRGEKLDDNRVLGGICKDGNSVIHLLLKKTVKDFLLEPLLLNPAVRLPQVIEDMFDRTVDGLNNGNPPVRTDEGTGGTYLMQDSTGLNYVSVFKPMDEEPMAVNNPLQLPVSSDGQGLKRGTRVGEGAIREVAAYLLDHPKNGSKSQVMGFAGVPPTAMVRSFHKVYNNPKGVDSCCTKDAKVGSLQMFMKNRKGKDGKTVLIPIDHGYCLPENFEDCTFEWLYWPQAKVPFSEDILNYVNSLDAEQDIALLRLNGWDVPEAVSRTLRISTMLLKKGVERNLTPYQIGSMMCRETVNKDSAIEEIVRGAHNSVLPASNEATFLEAVSVEAGNRIEITVIYKAI
ncbi:hypothetical protein Bca52824_060086 [Brassica carinata]|uniref:1-phosphatidylinositol 4-kinase n=1 Tax=Brassica carinata TaxID=52824 RepID=A0A8X7UHA0_BRACI|nr:hypothetical protein Bca52824_060086 [Brassica carinata]